MVGDVDHCFRFFQNWHTPELLIGVKENHKSIIDLRVDHIPLEGGVGRLKNPAKRP